MSSVGMAGVQTVRPAASHDGPVVALAFSPDSKTLASSGGGIGIWEATGAVKLWSVHGTALKPDGRIPDRPFHGVSGAAFYHTFRTCVHSLAFSPDGRDLVLGGNTPTTGKTIAKGPIPNIGWSMAGFVELRDVVSGKLKWVVNRPAAVESVAFSPTGKTIAAGGGKFGEGEAVMLGAAQGNLLWDSGHQPEVQRVAFSRDGRQLATISNWRGEANATSPLHFWNAVSGKLTRAQADNPQISADPSGIPFTLAVSPREPLIAVNRAGDSLFRNVVTLFNANTGLEARRFNFPGMLVSDLAFSPDGKWLVAGGGPDEDAAKTPLPQGQLLVWDAETGALKRTLKFNDRVTAVTFSPDGKLLATGTRGPTWGEVKLWAVQSLVR